MQYQTLNQIRQRCSEELPGFDGINDDALLRAWVWDALRKIDTERLGEPTDATITVINGKGNLPDDFLGIIGIPSGANGYLVRYSVDSGSRLLRGSPDGHVPIRYYAVSLDEEGYPYILDAAEDAVMAYVRWKFMGLQQTKMQMKTAFGFRIDNNLNRENERLWKEEMGHVRGDLNMMTPEEMARLRIFRQSILTYRNRGY